MSYTQPSPSFHAALDIIRYGDLTTELDEQLAEIVKAVQATGKVGELTLKIKVKKSKSDQIELSDAVIPKMPQPERKATYVFALENGAVSQADPRQRALDLAIKVAAEKATPITVPEQPKAPATKI